MHVTSLCILIVCRLLYAKVVCATSSEGFLLTHLTGERYDHVVTLNVRMHTAHALTVGIRGRVLGCTHWEILRYSTFDFFHMVNIHSNDGFWA